MSKMTDFERLRARFREISALGQAAGLLGWDQEAMMPAKGMSARAEQLSALEGVIHQKLTDAEVGEWLAAITPAELDPVDAVDLRLMAERHTRATALPARLVEETARLTAQSVSVWAAARETSDVKAFLPTLQRMVELKREAAACLSSEGPAYDTLLEEYEPGMTSAELDRVFGALRPGLVALRAHIAEHPRDVPEPRGSFPRAAQIEVSRKLATLFGYDWEAGRLDFAVHPFSSGGRGDARITTRVDEANPFDCLYSTIHEVGHAVYSQNLAPDLAFRPVGEDAGMGVHESQSRSFENQIGRSRAFAEVLFPLMREAFGAFGAETPEALYAMLNRVGPGFIRTEADEVHYNLHVMLRFDLERALIAGDLAVGDLEAAWNDRFRADFGVEVPDARRGVLQDVHWAHGLFGYFPTYALGNIYAGELVAQLRRDRPGLDAEVARGDLSGMVAWMREHVHRHARTQMPQELIAAATGHAPTPAPFLDYLTAKFTALYPA
ncbi:MAG: carboxypeptidase M32 [Pseudomonadota bacterium]